MPSHLARAPSKNLLQIQLRTKQEQWVAEWVYLHDWNHWCSFGPWNCDLFCKRYIKWEFRAMPGLLVAAELILTCYLTESPWIITSGSDRQVEHILIQGCVSMKRKTMGSIHRAGWKVTKTLSRFSMQYESLCVITCSLWVQVCLSIFEHFSVFSFQLLLWVSVPVKGF